MYEPTHLREAGGLVVDYIGVAQSLKSALQQYSQSDQENTGIDEATAVAVLMEKYEVVRDLYHGFDYATALAGSPHDRLVMMAGAIEWVLDLQQRLAAQESTPDAKKGAHRRYRDAVLALSKAFALASASDEARMIREEVGFFQAIGAALTKSAGGSGVTRRDRDLAIAQIVSRAVVSTEIIDWAHRESARARMRVLVKRILRKYGYPPDLQDTAVQTVLQQAEALSSSWRL